MAGETRRGAPTRPRGAVTYHRPPEDYVAPTNCAAAGCGALICYGPVNGDYRRWSHVGSVSTVHEVVVPGPWWDVRTGAWIEGVWGPPGPPPGYVAP